MRFVQPWELRLSQNSYGRRHQLRAKNRCIPVIPLFAFCSKVLDGSKENHVPGRRWGGPRGGGDQRNLRWAGSLTYLPTFCLTQPLSRAAAIFFFSAYYYISHTTYHSGKIQPQPPISLRRFLSQKSLSELPNPTLPLPSCDKNNKANMSVVGVDFGTLNTVIAVARNRGVDVVSTSQPAAALPAFSWACALLRIHR